MSFERIAPYLANPLVLTGFALLLLFGLLQAALKGSRGKAVDRTVRYGFIASLIVIVLGFATAIWRAEAAVRSGFDLTVRASAPRAPIIKEGEVFVDFGNDRRSQAFDKHGEADFKGVPQAMMGATVQVIPKVPGYVEKSYDATISGSVIKLTLEPLTQDADAAGGMQEQHHGAHGGHHHTPDAPPPTETASAPPPTPKDPPKPPPAVNSAIEITATDDVNAWTVGAPATQGFRIKGGTPPFYWSLAGPAISGLGLKADERDTRAAVITGAPTAAGTASMTLKVNDSTGANATKNYGVLSAPPVKITTARQVEAMLGVPFQRDLKAIGGNGPYMWAGERLPAWLAIDSKLGLMQGVPGEARRDAFSLTVIDAAGRRDQVEFKITAFRGIRVFIESAYKAPPDMIALLNEVKTGCLASAPYAIEQNREQADAVLIPADYEPDKNHVQLLLNSRGGLLLWGDTFNRDYVDGRWVLSPEAVAKKACGGREGLVRRAENIMGRL